MKQLIWKQVNAENETASGIDGFWYNILIGRDVHLEVRKRFKNIDFCEQTVRFATLDAAKFYAQLDFEKYQTGNDGLIVL